MTRNSREPAAGGSGLSENNTHVGGRAGNADRRTNRRVTATARAYPPGPGRRSTHLLIVTRCPFGCGGVHAHRGAEHGGPRKAGCGRGEYFVRPVRAARSVAA